MNYKNNRKNQPKWLYIIPALAVVCIIVASVCKIMLPDANLPADADTTDPTEATATEAPTQPSMEAPTEPTTEPNPNLAGIVDYTDDSWNLVLANPSNPLPEGFTVETAVVQGNYKMDKRAVEFAKAMIAAAKKDGINLLVCSAYRSHERQVELYEEKVNRFLKEGYSQKEAAEKAGKINAYPGTSEHESGLALDIVTPAYQNLNAGFDQTEAFEWLYTHCKEYGFILRYPEEKQDITKIIYEPWHYRYVGTKYSYKIMESGLCLEEFLEQRQ